MFSKFSLSALIKTNNLQEKTRLNNAPTRVVVGNDRRRYVMLL